MQTSLKENEGIFGRHAIKYLGMLLEYSQKVSWQHPNGSEMLCKLPATARTKELLDVIKRVSSRDDDIYKLVLSNEWILGRRDLFIPALIAAKELDCNVEIICYVRERGAWSRSANEQCETVRKNYT